MRLLLISGSTRNGSTNTAVLRTAAAVAPAAFETILYDGLEQLPAFNPDLDDDLLPAPAKELRSAIAGADAVLFSTPEYAGTLPGSFKNLLDWTVGGGEIYEKPVGWINASSFDSPTAGAGAHTNLATVLGYVGARVVPGACVRIQVTRQLVGDDGLIAEQDVRRGLVTAMDALLEAAQAGTGTGNPAASSA